MRAPRASASRAARWLRQPWVWFAGAALWWSFEASETARRIEHEETYIFDWDAYMEQVEQVQTLQERNYSRIRGDTGPLVYPAGHVLLHAFLHDATQWDAKHWTTEIHRVERPGYEARTHRPEATVRFLQDLYRVLYLVLLALVILAAALIRLPLPFLLLLALGERPRAIFVLGLFNDCWAMTLLFLSLALALVAARARTLHPARSRVVWALVCVVFSLAVSVKMNVLLFAPGLLLCLLRFTSDRNPGSSWSVAALSAALLRVSPYLLLCLFVQLLVAAPFLRAAPREYLLRAFDFGRVFDPVASVNWQFLPPDWFASRAWALGLLALHVLALALLARRFLLGTHGEGGAEEKPVKEVQEGSLGERDKNEEENKEETKENAKEDASEARTELGSVKDAEPVGTTAGTPTPSSSLSCWASLLFEASPWDGADAEDAQSTHDARFVAAAFVVANFAGVVFARSLHYQFYVWYFQTLPFLLFFADIGPLPRCVVNEPHRVPPNSCPHPCANSLVSLAHRLSLPPRLVFFLVG